MTGMNDAEQVDKLKEINTELLAALEDALKIVALLQEEHASARSGSKKSGHFIVVPQKDDWRDLIAKARGGVA